MSARSRTPAGTTERLFVAVPLAEAVRGRISAGLPRPLPGRAARPESWHLTLRFLGDAAPEAREAVAAGLEAAALGAPFTVRFGGLGAFPRPGRARVLWLGVAEGGAKLAALQRTVEGAVRAAGFPAEETPYTPHLTLSRLAPPAPLSDFLDRAATQPVEAEVAEIVLYRSHLGAGPARHEALRRFRLRLVD